ncbi:MAG: M28 family peptidase, partial [Schleiferiaceae bacterium]|nr:M28 family peptidase [Schleiferiaceae bacterium]
MKTRVATFFALMIAGFGFAQNCDVLPESALKTMKMDIQFLADDALEGRLPGTKGAMEAAYYISNVFKQAQLVPMGNSSDYLQQFEISDWVKVGKKKTFLIVNGDTLKVNRDFYPMPQSTNGNISGDLIYVGFGIEAADLEHNDYKKLSEKKLKDKIFVIDVSSPDGVHPHSKYLAYHNLDYRAELAVKKGAKGIIFINAGDLASDPKMKFRKIKDAGVPVVFLKNIPNDAKPKKLKSASMGVVLKERYIDAFNVVGFKNNNAPYTVVIGAHYDHLGWGADNSLYKGEPAIHNGADDNASGTAGLLELVRFFGADTTYKAANILFVAFSGEERGLLGSKFFVDNTPVSVDGMAYMLNMDMIGRMENRQLAISGGGTADNWKAALELSNCDMDLKLSESGV